MGDTTWVGPDLQARRRLKRGARDLILGGLVAFGLTTIALADTIQLKLTAAPGPSNTGFVTGPYTLTNTSTGLSFLALCDDFTTNVSLGHTWTANVDTLGNLSSLKFGASDPTGLDPSNTLHEYQAAFFLVDQLFPLNLSNPANQQQINDLSYAIWGIFSSNARSSSGYDTQAASLATSALAMSFSSTQYFNRKIYTPLPFSAAQEYLGPPPAPVPEPATLGLVSLGLGALLLVMWRGKLSTPAPSTDAR